MDAEKLRQVEKFPTPTKVKELQGFLGLAGFYRRVVEGFAHRALPLYQLLKGEQEWKWKQPQEEAFQDLKSTLITAPVLAMPDFKLPFTLYTDACGYAIGAVLAQKGSDGKEHPIAYSSRTLNTHEMNYTISELECLAVVWGIDHYKEYLLGMKFEVFTDHAALNTLLTQKLSSGRIARWILKLQGYDFKIQYRKGESMKHVDALSRLPGTSCFEKCSHHQLQEEQVLSIMETKVTL